MILPAVPSLAPSTTGSVRAPSVWAVLAVGLLIAVGSAVRLLAVNDWDASALLKVGEDSGRIVEYSRSLLGDVKLAPELGHDGKFFFIQANDPFYLDPEAHAALLDRPAYRAQRMLYPTLASGGGVFPPQVVVWSLLVVNVVSIAAGTGLTALLAKHRGRSPWLGLFFAVNIGLIVELFIDGAGALAFTLVVAMVLFAEKGRLGWAAAAAAGAVLTREAMMLSVIGLFACLLWRSRRAAWSVLIFPAGLAAVWALYLRGRLPAADRPQVEELGIPFKGMVIAASHWTDRPFDLVVALFVVAVSVVFVWRAVRSRDLLAWSALGFALLLPLLTEQVLIRYFDVTRAIAPVLTAYPLLLTPGLDRRGRPPT